MNNAWLWLSTPWAESLTWSLLHFLWLGTVWLVLGWILARFLRATHSRYALWLCVLTIMAASPAITFALLEARRPTEVALLAAPSGIATVAASWSLTVDAVASTDEWARWQPWLLGGWCAGVLLTSLRLAFGAWWVLQVTRHLSEWPGRWQCVAERLARRLKLRRLPRLGLSPHVAGPMAVRLWRPAVVLPASWLCDLPADVLEAVIAHELAHIRRCDLWINLLQRVVEALLFFHPAVWWVSRQIRTERELCCDALAVSATGRAEDYARALEWVATWRLAGAAGPLLATGLGGTRMVLLQRVRQVLGLESAADSSSWTWGVTGLGGLAACVTAAALWNATAQGSDEPAAPTDAAAIAEDISKLFAQRDDDDRPPRRPEPPRDGDRRGDGPRDGDRRPEPPRDGERRPDGPRDGERRPDAGPRDGERPQGGPRDGERRPDAGPRGERPPGPPRDGDRRPEGGPRDGGPRPPFADGDFRGPPEVIREMLRTLQELREEVQSLRREVNELRNQRPPFAREGGPRPEFLRDGPPGPPRGEGRPSPEARGREEVRPRPEGEFRGRGDGEARGREDGRGRGDGEARGREEGRPSPEAGRPGPRPEGREGPPRGEGRPQPRPEAERDRD